MKAIELFRIKKYYERFLLLICLFYSYNSYSQTIHEKLILSETKDSILIKSMGIHFDKEGNYLFLIKKNNKKYFVNNTSTIGGFDQVSSMWGKNAEIHIAKNEIDSTNEQWYYTNIRGRDVFWPVKGKLEELYSGVSPNKIALLVTYKDSIYYYLDGNLINVNHNSEIIKSRSGYLTWCNFSDNGNSIYYLKHDSLYFLYVNGKLVDSSNSVFSGMAVNNSGKYIYTTRIPHPKKTGKYNYMFFIHSHDSIIGPVSTINDFDLKDNGSYYYFGEDNGHYFIVINGRLYRNIESFSDIKIIDWDSFQFLFSENDSNKVNVNGKIYNLDFDEVFQPVVDKEGNFAVYGLKEYYIYKYVNGIEQKEPVTNYGVRPVPLYISSLGESLHYFQTDDSIYLYRDNDLVFPALSKNKNFKVLRYRDVISGSFMSNKILNRNSLFYLEYDSLAYMVFNGQFSKQMIPINFSLLRDSIGTIQAGEFNDSGFYIIQRVGKSKYLININNVLYKILEYVEEIIHDNCYFEDNELTFYGFRDKSYYQFRIKL
jgi:hypothetical protein